MDYTLRLISMTMDSLRMELFRNQDARFETTKDLAIYSVQCVQSTLTLLKTTLYDRNTWQVFELRSTQIPVEWNERCKLMMIFELSATLYVSKNATHAFC